MSDRALKRALFADLELTCWDGLPPAGEAPEIIQIGAAELDLETMDIRRTFSRVIKPVRSKVSSYCQALTGITPAMTRAGRSFEEAARSTRREFGSAPWMAWGDDESALNAAAIEHGCLSPLPGPQTNLSVIFHQMLGLDRKHSLEEALALLGLDFEGRPHDATTDAINTARLFAGLSQLIRARRTA